MTLLLMPRARCISGPSFIVSPLFQKHGNLFKPCPRALNLDISFNQQTSSWSIMTYTVRWGILGMLWPSMFYDWS